MDDGATREARNKKTHRIRLNRRGFLVGTGGAFLLAAAGLPRCTSGDSGIAQGSFPVGKASDFSVGDVRRFSEGPFFVLRDAEGLWAMSAVCTHQSCTVNTGNQSLVCPCHNSAFDLDGAVTRGPANAPLDNFAVSVDANDEVFVDTTEIVPEGTRTPV